MSLYQQGQLNTTALSVAGVYTQILQPNNPVINGIPTNNIGIVGTATWGPVNVPSDFGTYSQGASIFGAMQARQYDLMTAAYCATLQGANNITGVRVTDGTDTQASYALIRGRASTLTVNYRTSHQIRRMADRLLPGEVKDTDGLGEVRDRTVSIFDGPVPQVQRLQQGIAYPNSM